MSHLTNDLPPVRLTIVGKFWDSQIYSGALYLFGRDAQLEVVDWRNLVKSLNVPAELALAAEATFLGSSAYYSAEVRKILQDPEIEPVFRHKFRRLEEFTRELALNVDPFSETFDNPFPFPHADSDIHYGTIYVGNRSGVYRTLGTTLRKGKQGTEKISDVPALDLATKHSTVAVASGSEGLHELRSRNRKFNIEQVAKNVCSSCEWSYASIIGANQGRSLFVAAYTLEKAEDQKKESRRRERKFKSILSDKQLFSTLNFGGVDDYIEWGAKDRIYRYAAGRFETLQNKTNGTVMFEQLSERSISAVLDLTTFVAVQVAPFGTIMEFDGHISVILNSGYVHTFEGEPVSWRVFPRSLSYLNHLHIIYEDRLEIIAFTSDYLVRPNERHFGTEPVSSDESRRNAKVRL